MSSSPEFSADAGLAQRLVNQSFPASRFLELRRQWPEPLID
jgi:hypothetical protein